MSASTPGRPDTDDDLDRAYARAHALADDGRAPPASVRASVLAAASEVAAQARARPLAQDRVAPVAPPLAAVGRGRSMAVNLSSWRVRSGAAICAALLVALGAWRFDASHRADGGVQVATAALELAAPPTVTLPRQLPVPPLSAASYPLVPPPVVDDPVEPAPTAKAAARPAPREREKDVVVAQAESSYRSLRTAAQPETRAETRPMPAPAAPPAADTAIAATPAAPVALSPDTPAARPSAAATITAAAPPQLATLPPLPPSVVPRRLPVAPQAVPAPPRRSSADEVSVGAAEPEAQRVQIAGSSLRRVDAAEASGPGAESARRPALSGASARQPATTLHVAADRGDVETLKVLLADSTAGVDVPDAAGRTALLRAVLAQQAAAVRLLLAAGADPSRADRTGLTPRAAAQAGPNPEIAALLGTPR